MGMKDTGGCTPAHVFDTLALADSPVHRLDPRVKIVATLAFIVAVMSFNRYELVALTPFLLFPAVLFSLSALPARPLLTAVCAAAPFALMVGMFNPVFDHRVIGHIAGIEVSAGWVSFASILMRFLLTVGAALLLVATTGMYRTAMALERLAVPRVFVLQILFVWRYLFVLGDEAAALNRGRVLRSFGRPASVRLFGRLAGGLLLRTLDRAMRIHRAMLARGFDGTVRFLGDLRLRPADVVFCGGWCLAFAVMRLVNLPRLLGQLLTGAFS